MPTDLVLMLLSLAIAMLSSASTYSLIPMLGVVVAALGVSVWRLRMELKLREANASGNWAKMRAYSSGAVYVAVSRTAGWMKIGMTTKSGAEREKTLNNQMEGGQNDWSIQIYKPHWRAGRPETAVHAILKEIKIPSRHVPERKGKRTGRGSREIFQLNLESAEQAISSASKKIFLSYLVTIPVASVVSPIFVAVFWTGLDF